MHRLLRLITSSMDMLRDSRTRPPRDTAREAVYIDQKLLYCPSFVSISPSNYPTMAVANLHWLRQIHRLPAVSYSKSIFSRWSASAAVSPESSSSSSKKVSDRIVKLFAIDPEGTKKEIVGLTGQTLLKALANRGLIDPESHRLEDIDACSAECEVNIAQEWLEKLPPRSYDEEYVLKRNSRARVLNKHSRLGCQVILTPDLQGMVVAVPEPKPWDIP